MPTDTSRRSLLTTLAGALYGTLNPSYVWSQSAFGLDFRLATWPEQIYATAIPTTPRDPQQFDLATARTMAWAAQLAYEVGRSVDYQNKVALRWG
jgi:hypothetical protein